MQSRQMSENYVNATLSDLNDLTNAILSNPDVQSTLETKPEDDYEYLRSDETLSMVVRTQTQTKPYITSSLIYAANGGLKHSLYQGNVSVRFGGSSYIRGSTCVLSPPTRRAAHDVDGSFAV